jgi:hypothetical protein
VKIVRELADLYPEIRRVRRLPAAVLDGESA